MKIKSKRVSCRTYIKNENCLYSKLLDKSNSIWKTVVQHTTFFPNLHLIFSGIKYKISTQTKIHLHFDLY